MKLQTWVSAGVLALSGAVIAQVSTAPEPKLGNTPDSANVQANAAGTADNISGNDSDPGKR